MLAMSKTAQLGENAFVAESAEFLELDGERLEGQVAKSGAEDGGKNYPRADAKQLAADEHKIIQQVSQTAQQTWDALQSHFTGFAARLVPIAAIWDPQAKVNTISDIAVNAQAQMTGVLRGFQNQSAIVVPRWRNAKQEYQNFRTQHERTGSPEYKTIPAMIAWFVAIMGIECILNASLLWELTGILTAVAQIMLISSVNVVIFAAGVGLPCRFLHLRYKTPLKRKLTLAWSTVVVLIFVAAAITFNFGVGHYRDSLVEAKAQGEQLANFDWDNIGEETSTFIDFTKQAMTSLLESPFAIESVLSVLLIIVGLGFFSFAAYKWYSMFGVVHGYRPRHIELEAAHREYVRLVEDTRSNLTAHRDRAIALAKDERVQIIKLQRERADLVGRGANLQAQYRVWVEVLGNMKTRLIAVYRRHNEQSRTDSPPKHFDEPVEPISDEFLTPPEFNAPTFQNMDAVIEAVQESVNNINQAASKIFNEFESSASDALDENTQ